MKLLITILLLLVVAGHTARTAIYKNAGFKIMQDLDDKKDNESKKDNKDNKDDKEAVSQPVSFASATLSKQRFFANTLIINSSPVIDHLTPPPDFNGR